MYYQTPRRHPLPHRYTGVIVFALVITLTYGLAAALDSMSDDVSATQHGIVRHEQAREGAETARQRVLYANGCRPPCTLDDLPAGYPATAKHKGAK
jgi:hypothetical protein